MADGARAAQEAVKQHFCLENQRGAHAFEDGLLKFIDVRTYAYARASANAFAHVSLRAYVMLPQRHAHSRSGPV